MKRIETVRRIVIKVRGVEKRKSESASVIEIVGRRTVTLKSEKTVNEKKKKRKRRRRKRRRKESKNFFRNRKRKQLKGKGVAVGKAVTAQICLRDLADRLSSQTMTWAVLE